MPLSRVCVFCASSRQCDPAYTAAARALGRGLAAANIEVVYGGGATGLMGAVADAALDAGGSVVGVLPRFMEEKELAHPRVRDMRIVGCMQERLRVMLDLSDAFVALPGGCGTLEELFYALTRKRLGLHAGPVVIVNIRGYFDPCLAMLDRCVSERFMDGRHAAMWAVAPGVEHVLPALNASPAWSAEHACFAVP
jgi:uncharacterized protein (TIGR00730 family)